jgi:rod shape-determining protein MreD
VPDFLALVLVFWNIRQPHKVGIGIAFLFGLLMDVHNARCWASARWPTACCRTARSPAPARALVRRVRARSLHVLPLFCWRSMITLLVRAAVGSGSAGWSTCCPASRPRCCGRWPKRCCWRPQRRAIERDENRPL